MSLQLDVLEARALYPNGLDNQELREQDYGLIATAKESNLLSANAVQTIEQSWGRPAVKIPVLSQNKQTVTSGQMDCTFGDQEINGTFADVTFVSGYVNMSLPYREAYTQDLTRAQIYARLLRDAELSIFDDIETKLFNLLDNAKATTYNSDFVGVGAQYPLVGDAMQVSNAQRQMYFNYLKAIMKSDNFSDRDLRVIANTNLSAFVAEYINQGNANNTNSQFQYSGYNFKYSNSVVNTAATSALATGFVMPPNSIAMHSKVSPEAMAGNIVTGDGISWATVDSPMLGLKLEIKHQSKCADVSLRTGNADDIGGYIDKWKIGYNIAFLTPYATGTNSGIKKFDFLV